MDFLELVRSRKSIRSYKPNTVEKEKLDRILEAGRLAPSACNKQPWRLFVIDSPEGIARMKPVYDRDWFVSAPVILVVCRDNRNVWIRNDGRDYGDVDAAIIMDHIILAATELDLGTCWIGAFNRKIAHEVLELSDDYEPLLMTPLGYPAESGRTKVRKQLSEIITRR